MYPREYFWCNLCDGGQNLPLGWNIIIASENLGATTVVPVNPCCYIPDNLFLSASCLIFKIEVTLDDTGVQYHLIDPS